jgi:hypothetical protein
MKDLSNLSKENLSDAVGEIREEIIARADEPDEAGEQIVVFSSPDAADTPESPDTAENSEIRRVRVPWKWVSAAAAALVLAVGTAVMLRAFAPAPEPAAPRDSGEDTSATLAATTEPPPRVRPAPTEPMTWDEPQYSGELSEELAFRIRTDWYNLHDHVQSVDGVRIDHYFGTYGHDNWYGIRVALMISDDWTGFDDAGRDVIVHWRDDLYYRFHDGQEILIWHDGRFGTIEQAVVNMLNYSDKRAIMARHREAFPANYATPLPERPITRPPDLEDLEILADFVQRVSSGFGAFPFFSDINEVSLCVLHSRYLALNGGYDWCRIDEFNAVDGQHRYGEEMSELTDNPLDGAGISPARLQAFMREYFNPNFDIESYDYRNASDFGHGGIAWDSGRGLIIQLMGGTCAGSAGSWTQISEIHNVGDEYHVDVFRILTYMGWIDETISYDRFVFTRNANGNFNIMSIQPVTVLPQRARNFVAFAERMMNDPEAAVTAARDYGAVRACPWGMGGCSTCRETRGDVCTECVTEYYFQILEAALPSFFS